MFWKGMKERNATHGCREILFYTFHHCHFISTVTAMLRLFYSYYCFVMVKVVEIE